MGVCMVECFNYVYMNICLVCSMYIYFCMCLCVCVKGFYSVKMQKGFLVFILSQSVNRSLGMQGSFIPRRFHRTQHPLLPPPDETRKTRTDTSGPSAMRDTLTLLLPLTNGYHPYIQYTHRQTVYLHMTGYLGTFYILVSLLRQFRER